MPNLCIIFSIVFIAHVSERHALCFAIVSGVLQDVFLGKIIGVNVIAYVGIVYAASYLIRVLFKGNYLTPIFLVATATGLYHFIFYVVMFFFQSTIPLSLLMERIATEVVLNSIIGLWFYAIVFKKVNGYKLGDFNA